MRHKAVGSNLRGERERKRNGKTKGRNLKRQR
jgi:hypothetical protein